MHANIFIWDIGYLFIHCTQGQGTTHIMHTFSRPNHKPIGLLCCKKYMIATCMYRMYPLDKADDDNAHSLGRSRHNINIPNKQPTLDCPKNIRRAWPHIPKYTRLSNDSLASGSLHSTQTNGPHNSCRRTVTPMHVTVSLIYYDIYKLCSKKLCTDIVVFTTQKSSPLQITDWDIRACNDLHFGTVFFILFLISRYSRPTYAAALFHR